MKRLSAIGSFCALILGVSAAGAASLSAPTTSPAPVVCDDPCVQCCGENCGLCCEEGCGICCGEGCAQACEQACCEQSCEAKVPSQATACPMTGSGCCGR